MLHLVSRRLSRTLRRAAVLGFVGALAIVPSSALAAQPIESFHDHFTDTFSDQLCGIDVNVALTVTDNFSIFADWSVKGTGSSRGIVTNPRNGKQVVLSTAGQFSDVAPVIDEAAGTITFHPTNKGLPLKVQTAGGSVLLRDAGYIAFAVTFDLDTGDFIAGDVLINKGPHPQIDSDGTRFCEVISGALS